MRPVSFIKLVDRLFMERAGGKKVSLKVTPETFDPNKCRQFNDDAVF
jgi:hypothetical protein